MIEHDLKQRINYESNFIKCDLAVKPFGKVISLLRQMVNRR